MRLLLITLAALVPVNAYHILCVQTFASTSHYSIMYGIIKPLLEAGHEVTFITTYPEKNPSKNLHTIDVSAAKKHVDDFLALPYVGLTELKKFSRDLCQEVVRTPAVRDILISNQFDLVISEWFFSDLEAGFSAVLQTPWVLLSGIIMHPRMEYLVDTVRSLPTTPATLRDYPIPLSFRHRVMNTVTYLQVLFDDWKDYSSLKSQYESLFTPIADSKGISLPPYSKAIHNISLVFSNSHPTLAPALSLPPNVIDVGGYHIDEETPHLPEDLQSILDSSTEGVIYFSMGSLIDAASMPVKMRRGLLKLFSNLPYTVLWKFDEDIEHKPNNVHIRPWMRQSSILAHPNVKLFITHGGLLSILESLHFGVPVVVVAVFGDQFTNAQRAVEAGYALKINFSPNIADDLAAPLTEILSNERYYQRAKYLSKLFQNRPVPVKKLIQFYINYVIESKGAHHLRSKALLYKWYELWMMDQLAFFIATLYILYRVVKMSYVFVNKFRNNKEKQH